MKQRRAAFKLLLGLGFYVALCIVAGTGLGLWLDHRLGTGVVMTLLGLGLGLILAVYGVYEMLIPLLRNKHDKGDN